MPKQSTFGPPQEVISRPWKDNETYIGYLDPESNQEIGVSRVNGFQGTISAITLWPPFTNPN